MSRLAHACRWRPGHRDLLSASERDSDHPTDNHRSPDYDDKRDFDVPRDHTTTTHTSRSATVILTLTNTTTTTSGSSTSTRLPLILKVILSGLSSASKMGEKDMRADSTEELVSASVVSRAREGMLGA